LLTCSGKKMSEINYEIINQYLEGELSGEALLAFEQEMLTNPSLAKEVALYKNINDEMSAHLQQEKEEQALIGNLKKLSEQYFKKPAGKVRSINRWWYAGVAAAAAAVLLFVIRPFSGSSFNNEKLYTYYIKDVESLPGGERGNPDDSLLVRAADLYNQKDYTKALPLLRDILARKPDETQVKLASGVCYLQTGQFDSATRVFNEIVSGTTVFKNEAVWYKALSALKQNKLDECYRILESLPAEASRYKEAKELMKKIKSRRKAK
jgi:predicted Zn-dependent protease